MSFFCLNQWRLPWMLCEVFDIKKQPENISCGHVVNQNKSKLLNHEQK
jgi:hypothetical protein